MVEKLKKIGFYIVVAVFWIVVAVTVIGGCFGTFFKSSDDSQDDYEEFFHSRTP